MALGTTDISTQIVANALGVSTGDIASLCTSSLINKWSYYKPVTGTWPEDSITNSWFGIEVLNNWNYTPPANDDRLGDFRGYEHAAEAPFSVDDEDHSIYAPDIYPNGNPDHFDAYFWVHNTPVSGSVSIGDLNLSNYYLCLKAVVGTETYYKTYNVLSSYTDYTIITISPSIITPPAVPYAFTNYPYFIGQTTIYFGFANIETNGWVETANLPTGFLFYLAPDYLQQNYPAIINQYTFTIHDWVYLNVTGMGFEGTGYTYQVSHIDTNLQPWSLMSQPTWIDITVWKDGTQISNSSLWEGDMDIHVVPNSNNSSGTTRIGLIEIGDTIDVLATIGVSQASGNDPYVSVNTNGFGVSESGGDVAVGSISLTYHLTPTNVGLNVLCDVVLLKNGTQIDTDTIILKDNSQYNGGFTLAVAADYNDAYIVQITKS